MRSSEPSKSLAKLKKEIRGITESIQKVKDQIRKQRIEREEKRRARERRLAEKERQRELYSGYGMVSLWWFQFDKKSKTRTTRS